MYDEKQKKKVTRALGLGQVIPDCAKCNARLKRSLGCHRYGNSFASGSPIRIAKEATKTSRGSILFCPRSFDQPLLETAVFECLNVVERNGGLKAAYPKPVYHLWTRQVDFYTEVINARDNYLSERGA